MESQNKIKNLEEMLVAKDKIIEALEDKLTKVYETEASKREQELQKIRLRYEMMARLELNSKLAEVNHFLEKRAMEHNENIKEKDLITDQIQKDLSNRLSQSRDELLKIKDQMKGIFMHKMLCYILQWARKFKKVQAKTTRGIKY